MDTNDNLFIVWHDGPGSYAEIYFKKSTDGGTNWSAPQRLTWTTGFSTSPYILTDSSNTLHIVWEYYKWGTLDKSQIFYKKSIDGGSTWLGPERLTWTPDHSNYPTAAADTTNKIHVVWRDSSPGNEEIYYKRNF